MRFNNIVALLAVSQTGAVQAFRARQDDESNTVLVAQLDPVTDEPSSPTTGTSPGEIESDSSTTDMASTTPTRSPLIRSTTSASTTSVRDQVGIETVSIVSPRTGSQGRRRQNVPSPVVATVAICPIYATQVPGTPCYPCAVGQPNAQQTLGVVTTSVLGITPDPTPVFFYSFCAGCEASLVTLPVPGYTPGSRNFASCLLNSVDPASSPTPTSVPVPSTSSTGTIPPPITSFIPGFTTTTFVTATIINLVEVVSICSTNGAITTVIEQSATCTTYATCVTIPASLCSTYVSTQPNGVVTTCTTPVDTWTAILTTEVTATGVQTITATATATAITAAAPIVPAGYNPVAAVSPVVFVSPVSVVSPPVSTVSPGSVPAKTTTYVQSGAGRLVASLAAILTSILALIF